VGRAANKAVVASVIMIVAANYVLNTAVYGMRGGTVQL
jgi:ABC-type transporter Mla maintaining outer membrane lipid asymmetry permease subunit MlaE